MTHPSSNSSRRGRNVAALSWRVTLLCTAFVLFLSAPPPPASAQTTIYVNTTDDPTDVQDECQTVTDDCSLRGALNRARLSGSGAVITACFDPALVPGAPACPPRVKMLTARERGWDEASGMFFIRPTKNRTLLLAEGAALVDFRQGVGTWRGPVDNRIVVDFTGSSPESAFRISSSNNVLAGFEIRGAFERAAIFIPGGTFGDPAEENQIGPGMVLAHITLGNGILITNDIANSNRVFGNWCGVNGDGTNVAPVFDDCVRISEGSFGNVIGDLAPENRNVFSSSELGSGILVEGPEATENRLQGNWFGLDAAGNIPSQQLQSGIQLVNGPTETIVERNVISGNDNAGLAVFDAALGTVIRNNIIGADPAGENCVENLGYGITLNGGPSESVIEDNVIRCNKSGGILLAGGSTRDNVLRRNRFAENDGFPIHVIQGANRGVKEPVITAAGETEVQGTACAGCTVEVFSDPFEEAIAYEGEALADSEGNWRLRKAEGFTHRYLTATATKDLNTSGLATHMEGSGEIPPTPLPVTPTITPDGPTVTPTFIPEETRTPTPPPTMDPASKPTIYLPWSAFNAEISVGG